MCLLSDIMCLGSYLNRECLLEPGANGFSAEIADRAATRNGELDELRYVSFLVLCA